MKKILWFAAAAAALGLSATAQEQTAMARPVVAQLKVMGASGAVMGPAVKGAPYSGEEVTEADQVLGDGTHIHNQTRTKVYRDGEGRVRRETPEQITIMDPVAGVSFMLNPSTMTVRKMTFSFVTTRDDAEGTVSFRSGGALAGPVPERRRVSPAPEGLNTVTIDVQTEDKARTEKLVAEGKMREEMDMAKGQMAQLATGTYSFTTNSVMLRSPGKKDDLGTQAFEGVPARGNRTTSTIEAGAIGNDRALSIVSERWFSSDLKTVMMTSHSDPRTGTESFRLINVIRAEPSASLFQVGPEYRFAEPQPALAPPAPR